MSTKSEAVIGQVGQLHTPIRLLGVIWSIGKKKRNLFDIGVIQIYNALPALKNFVTFLGICRTTHLILSEREIFVCSLLIFQALYLYIERERDGEKEICMFLLGVK